MTEKNYHHGDLRNALIETGIELINEKGIRRFSLRGVAAKCGVSHTAPYAHFKDMDELLRAMSEHVATRFVQMLQAAIEGRENQIDVITSIGKAYITFFMEHPNYFQFLFYSSGMTIDLDDEHSGNYPPFALFRDAAYRSFQKAGLPPETQKQILIAKWALVHGIAAMATSKYIKYSGDWRELLR